MAQQQQTQHSSARANAHAKAEIAASETRLEHVAQHFSVEWKKFLAYAMTVRQQAGADDDADAPQTLPASERSGLEDLLLQSQSGLVMLREMKHQRERKWKEIAELYGYDASPSSTSESESDASRSVHTPRDAISGDLRVEPSQPLVARLIALHQQRARTSRVFLTRTRQESEVSRRHMREQFRKREHAATKALVEAAQHQHRLAHAVGIATNDRNAPHTRPTTHSLHAIQAADMETLLEFEHARRRMALPFERLFVRVRWLCTSHRYHVRQRMLALFHQQRAKNAPVAVHAMVERIRNLNAVAAGSAAGGLVHCPLFVHSAIQLEAELAKLVHRHLPAHAASVGVDGGLAGVNIVELKVLVEQLFDQCVKSTAIQPTGEAARDGSSGNDGGAHVNDTVSDSEGGGGAGGATAVTEEPFFAKLCADSHWDLRQLDVLESSSRACGDALAADSHDDDPLLRSEWELLRLDDREYLRVRLGVLARSHFERAQVAVNQSGSGSVGSSSSCSSSVNATERSDQLLEGDELVSPDALYVLYMLRVVVCRSKRQRLLRLLNYSHFLALSRRTPPDDMRTGVGAAVAGAGASRAAAASSAGLPHPASHLRVEKRQNEFVVVEPRNRGGAAGAAAVDDGAVADKELVLPAAMCDLETIERRMLRTASVFVEKQERASLPGLNKTPASISSSSSSSSSSEHVVMAIDRLQVMCDAYESELRFLQAKLQLAQLLLKNGLEYALDPQTSEAPASSATHPPATAPLSTDALLAVFQRRPLIDFSHAYFYESYAAETLHLELQASLQQQIHGHFAACEQEAVALEGQEAPFCGWLDHQAIRADLLARLLRHQRDLLREAEQRWLCVGAVGELHALRQAVYEQILVNWKLIVSLELAAAPAQCLERGGDSVLSGTGWQLVFPTALVLDCCRNAQQHQQQLLSQSPLVVDGISVDPHAAAVETMATALAVIEWHQSLGRQVYEAELLERVYAFQYSFVRAKDSGDAAALFFFGAAGSRVPAASGEGTSGGAGSGSSTSLVPAALELIGERDSVHLTTGSATGANKTVPEWLEAQLLLSLDTAADDGAASAASLQWQPLFLAFQRRWTRFLGAAVRYQDLIGSEIFEFASCSPFLFLEAASSSRTSSANAAPPPNALLSAKSVQGRYAEEIAEKMKEEMQQNCYPYWVSLARLKEQVRRQFERGASLETTSALAGRPSQAPGSGESTDGLSVADVDPGSVDAARSEESELEEGPASVAAMMQRLQLVQRFAACAQYLRAEGAIPKQLVRVNRFLARLRGERALMQTLSSSAAEACVFAPSRVSEEHDSCKKSTLMRWLTSKLQQLREDLHSSLDATRSGDCVPIAETGRRSGEGDRHRGDGDEGGGDDVRLLLLLPSHLYLIDQFAVPLCRDPPTGTLAATHSLANEERVETLRLLGSILEAFDVGMDLVRVKSSFHFATKRLKRGAAAASGGGRSRDANSTGSQRARSTRARGAAAHGLLEQWQVLYHDNLRGFHDRILEALPPSVASCNIFTRSNVDKVKLANRSQREALQAIRDCVRKAESELAASTQCMTSFLRMQAISSSQRSARRTLGSEQQHMHFRRCLLSLATRLRDLRARRRAVQRSSERCEAPAVQDAPVVSSASEMLQLVFRAPGDGAATLSEAAICAFWDELATVERDEAYVGSLTNWMDLQLVFLAECTRPALLASPHWHVEQTAWFSESTASRELEESAIAALDKLWDRYELIAGEGLASSLAAEDPSGAGGDELDRLSPAGTRANCFDRWPLRSRHRHDAFAYRHDPAFPHSNLPSRDALVHRLEFLRLGFELRWLQADIAKMEHHYEAFLHQKKRSQRARGELSHSSRLPQHHLNAGVASPTLLTLNRFYCAAGDSDDGVHPLAPSGDAFVVPASEMSLLLQDLATECARHHASQADAYEDAAAHLQRRLLAAERSVEELQETLRRDTRQEAIRREAFAIDHAYQLHFRMALLRREVEGVENRVGLERLELQCELSAAYDKKLAAMHAQVLAKQQRFDEFRVAMQHDLHVQLQGAQAQLVHQLVDHSGSLSVETKAGFLASLHGQHAGDHVALENVALKQTLLKLQSLLEMQRQSHSASHEREQALHRRHKTANLLLRSEAAQLQQQLQQLEADLARVSHEKTGFMLKWSSLQKQTEAAAHRKREAKIRALSAPFHRAAAAAAGCSPLPTGEVLINDDEPHQTGLPTESLAGAMGVAGAPHQRRRAPRRSSFDDDEEAFERHHEVAIRHPSPRRAGPESERDDRDRKPDADPLRHLQNSARHYQNEIRRLQQQLAKEAKASAALRDQVTQLRSAPQHPADVDSNQALEGDADESPEAAKEGGGDLAARPRSTGSAFRAMSTGAGASRVPSASFGRVLASPRARAQSASVCTPARPSQPPGASVSSASAGTAPGVPSQRPSTSFSPRASAMYRVQAAASPRSAGLPPTATTPSAGVSSGGPATPARRFEVQKRSDAKVGGIAGVPNVFSAREPLPYR